MKRWFAGLFVAAVFGGVSGCMNDADEQVGEQESELGLTGGWYYDTGNQCVVGGLSIHCCPNGYVMIGAQVGNNVFKCGQIAGTGGAPFADLHTQRNGMHACPSGTVMVGLHAGRNVLLCQQPATAPSFEYVDGNSPTQDSYPMHVCSNAYAMAGINVGANLFTCDF